MSDLAVLELTVVILLTCQVKLIVLEMMSQLTRIFGAKRIHKESTGSTGTRARLDLPRKAPSTGFQPWLRRLDVDLGNLLYRA